MEEKLERLYRRLGRRYALLFVAWIAIVAILTGGLSVSAAFPYLEASRGQVLRIFLAWQIQTNIALVVIVLIARRFFRNALVWGSGQRTPEVAANAWNELVINVPRLCVIGALLFIGLAIPAEFYIESVLDLPWYSIPIMFIGGSVVVIAAAMLDYFGVETLCRPLLREMAELLPSGFKPLRPSPAVRWKVFGATTTISFMAAAIGAETAAAELSPVQRMGVGIGGALLVTGTIGLVMTMFLNRSLITPIDELVAGTRRVEAGDLEKRVPLLAADEIGSLTQSFNGMMAGLVEREALLSAMGVYVDPEVAARVLKEGQLLAGEEVEVTVLFLDIRDFTAFAERRTPQETVSYLNEFFSLVVPAVAKYGGHANKFLGDGLLAVFGAPARYPDHAERAVAAAKEIVDAVTRRPGAAVRVGIGINSGKVVVGSVGGGGRLEFTLIGDTVNVASRVERLCKETGDVVLITETTRELLSRSAVALEPRGLKPVRGKTEKVAIYALAVSQSARDGAVAGSSPAPPIA